MLSYFYSAVSVVVGFAIGWLFKRHLSAKIIHQREIEISSLKADHAVKLEELNVEYAEEAKKLELALSIDCSRQNGELRNELNIVTRERDVLRAELAIVNNKVSSLRDKLKNVMSEHEHLLSQLDESVHAKEVAETNLSLVQERLRARNTSAEEQLDLLKNELESVRHSWWADYHKLNKRNEETILVRDAELERRRQVQLELLLQVRELNAAPEAKSLLCQALEDTVVPDLSHGVVFIKKDLSSGVYHHVKDCTGTGDLILASKVFAEKAGFKACTCCAFVPSPDAGVFVYRSSFSSKTYHRPECRDMRKGPSFQHVPLPITDALRLGLRPCGHCKPPVEPPFNVFF